MAGKLLVTLTVWLVLGTSEVSGNAPAGMCESLTVGLSKCLPGPTCPTNLRQIDLYTMPLCPPNHSCCFGSTSKTSSTTTTTTSTTTTTEPPDVCGLGGPADFQRRILNGDDTGVCKWPFVVSIRALSVPVKGSDRFDHSTTRHKCGGILVGNEWVLTHPYCCFLKHNSTTVSEDIVVVAGEYDTDMIDRDDDTGDVVEEFIEVAECIINPDFSTPETQDEFNKRELAEKNGNATALLRLKQAISSPCASKVCLPSTLSSNESVCGALEECVILDWGVDTPMTYSNPLKEAKVKLYNDSVCDYMTRLLSEFLLRPAGSVCQVPVAETGVRGHDWGGPVLCKTGSVWSVRGILPIGFYRDESLNLPFIIDIAPSEAWIRHTIGLPPLPT